MADYAPQGTAPSPLIPLPTCTIPGRMRHFDDRRHEFAPYGFTCEVWEPREMPRPDRHDEIEVNFLDRGTLTYLIGGRRVAIPPRRVTVFWAAVPHQIVAFEDNMFYYVVTIPFGWVLRWGLPDHLLEALLHGRVVTAGDGGPDAIDPLMFERWHRDVKTDLEAYREIVLLELRARLLRLARRSPVPGVDPASVETPRDRQHTHLEKAEAMACHVARHYTTSLRVGDIASRVGLTPDYAGTLFRKVFGMTLSDLIARHRVAHAQRCLVITDDPILRIALDSGFDSLSRFNRAFKQLAGMTPREYRRMNVLRIASRGTGTRQP